jgi:glutamine synthetase
VTETLTPEGLVEAGIETVILAAPDLQGRLFGKRVPPARFGAAMAAGIDVCTCALAWDVAQDLGMDVSFAGFHTGWHDFVLMPDVDTLRPAAWLDGVAVCMADVVEHHGGPLLDIAPRSVLRRQIERLAALGYDAYVGSEPEFYLFRPGYDEAREGGYRNLRPTRMTHDDYLIQPANALEPFFRELRGGLIASGIDVELSQIEWGRGQWEMNVAYGPALENADCHVLFKMAVKDLAARNGMAATFMARPSGDMGSSNHFHVSLRDRDGAPAFHDARAADRLSAVGRQAIAGVLARAGELMLCYAPTINSYRRAAGRDLVAGFGATWGYDNRTTSMRVVGGSPSSLRMEWRVPGADVNAHVAVAALLASVADGIERGLDPGPAIEGNAYERDVEPLPRDLRAAAEAFAGSAFAREAFGDRVVEHYAAAAEFEWRAFMDTVTEWEVDRYFEHI